MLLGGARSGKSRFGEEMIESRIAAGIYASGVYLATAEAGDGEMTARIEAHRARRGDDWQTVEEPLAMAAKLAAHSGADIPILVDCLTLWLSNLMAAGRNLDDDSDALIDALAAAPGPVVLVSNEVGQGLVPMNKLGRDFRDAAGVLNQRVAAAADAVALMVAGLPLPVKGHGWFSVED